MWTYSKFHAWNHLELPKIREWWRPKFLWKVCTPEFYNFLYSVSYLPRYYLEMIDWQSTLQSRRLFNSVPWGPFIYYVSTCKMGGQKIPIFSVLKACLRRGGGGPKILKTCLHNVWMVPSGEFMHYWEMRSVKQVKK